MFPVTANMLFTVYEYKGLRPDSMEGDYKSPPQYHWMAYPMERSNMIRHNNKRIKKNKNQLDIISTTSHMCLLSRMWLFFIFLFIYKKNTCKRKKFLSISSVLTNFY